MVSRYSNILSLALTEISFHVCNHEDSQPVYLFHREISMRLISLPSLAFQPVSRKSHLAPTHSMVFNWFWQYFGDTFNEHYSAATKLQLE